MIAILLVLSHVVMVVHSKDRAILQVIYESNEGFDKNDEFQTKGKELTIHGVFSSAGKTSNTRGKLLQVSRAERKLKFYALF